MAGLLLLGGGAHCRVVIDALACGDAEPPAGVIDLAEHAGGEVDGIPVVGTEADLARLRGEGLDNAFVTLGTAGTGDARARLFEAAGAAGYVLPVVVHPDATVAGSAVVGAGSFIAARAVVGVGARIGQDCIINTGAVVDHDCVVGDHVHVAPGATVSGGVRIGAGSLIGVGSSIVQGLTVGARTVIGAGSAVTSDIGDGVVAYGVPCREAHGA